MRKFLVSWRIDLKPLVEKKNEKKESGMYAIMSEKITMVIPYV